MTIRAFGYWRSDKKIVFLSVASLLGIVFQAWLGKTVVDSNLLPLKITIHMLMALVMVAFLVILLYRSQSRSLPIRVSLWVKKVALAAFVLTLIQIITGTQVRQFVDEQMHFWNLENASQWLNKPSISFYFHRSFSLAVLGIHAFLWYRLRKEAAIPFSFKMVLLVLTLEIGIGMAMYYFDFPFSSQPLHLLLACYYLAHNSFFF